MASTNSSGYDRFSTFTRPPLGSTAFTQATATGIPMNQRPKHKVSWSSGLCDCFSDCRNCCLTCWCPCMTFGQIAEIVDKGSSSCGVSGALCTLICCVTCCPCCFTCFYRSKMRQQFLLKEKPCCDCLVHCCCMYCALCQEHRELKNRGFDLTVGWHGNLDKETRGPVEINPVPVSVEMTPMTPLAPVIEEGMSRDLSD